MKKIPQPNFTSYGLSKTNNIIPGVLTIVMKTKTFTVLAKQSGSFAYVKECGKEPEKQ